MSWQADYAEALDADDRSEEMYLSDLEEDGSEYQSNRQRALEREAKKRAKREKPSEP